MYIYFSNPLRFYFQMPIWSNFILTGRCREDEYQCSTHECIPFAARCDGIIHCKEASDETNCVHLVDQETGTMLTDLDTMGIIAVGAGESGLSIVCGDEWMPFAVGKMYADLACR